jgi:antitoxin MazE
MAIASIQKWGNSQGLRISKELLRELGWEISDELLLTKKGNKLIIEPITPKRKTIKELFEGSQNAGKSKEVDWGGPVGEEVW